MPDGGDATGRRAGTARPNGSTNESTNRRDMAVSVTPAVSPATGHPAPGRAVHRPSDAQDQAPAPAQGPRDTAPVRRIAPPPAARQATDPATAPPRRPARGNTSVRPLPAATPVPEGVWGHQPRNPRPARGRSRDDIGWVKAHGGAGTTSMVELFGGVDVGARWPEPARGEPRRVVLVGRTSEGGLRSVSQALGALKEGHAPQGIDLLCVVLVADAPGMLPLSLLRRIRVIRSVVRVHRVPWIPAWRVGNRPQNLPKQIVRLAEVVGSRSEREGAR
ncbi:hypothetical protein ABZ896_44015 [Streptomyces sp. NPDC047072]|uniref:hypothetical protein n=1 Tax=Streptomyces sp. NPDC047072 TaxID=3154809 RepID=UPI0033FA4637